MSFDLDHPDVAHKADHVRRLVAARRTGFSLDAPFYLSDVVFDVDMHAIFGRHWIFVGVEASIPEPGQYFLADFGPYSIIVSRGDGFELNAFHNVCRHRGARLLHEQHGEVANLVCPYHQWTYAPTGALLHAELPAGADNACYSLKRAHVRSLGGLIFVCAADEPPGDFDALVDAVGAYVDPHRLRDCKVAQQIDIVEDGNWKLAMENNRECYHCMGHPELLQSTFGVFGYTEDDVNPARREAVREHNAALAASRDIWARNGLPCEPVEHLDDRATAFRIQRVPLTGPGESMTLDGKAACSRLMGDFTEARLGRLQFHLQPNSWHHLQADHSIHFAVLPISAGKTLLRTTWLVHRDAVEGRDYSLDNLTHVWKTTNEQDKFYVGLTQQGARNPAYEPGPYAPSEWQVEKFCNWYIGRLRTALGEH
ncbi:aromatic ring-hydroxylating oxygenase subunit alpha [Burkholderia anthina]|uniref:(Fe-S)-binding protein n=1 Tax=Burkholderia anthina TaxID=179879 RepID=A0A6P2GIM6_9BURK|nr:aromatic ring-hydroxylating dioxygenase subunit alpha [Burkholderia anthina]VVU52977.1 (Fe-S)-binding protein [Burkholderia anthina]